MRVALLRTKLLFSVVLLFFGFSLHVNADPAVWQIKTDKNTVYLFGSIHVANKTMYPLGRTVEEAFNDSNVLVVEVDETQADQVKLQELLVARGFYPGAETIQNHIGEDTFLLLQQFLQKTGIPYITVARMRPGLAAITLTVASLAQMGYTPELGIDRYFMKKARGKKPIHQLETAQEQMELLLSFSDDDLLLKQTLVSLQELEKMIGELSTAWKTGDEATLQKLLVTDQLTEFPEFSSVLKRLIDDRNVTMAIKIQQLLNSDKNYFVVVGAGHLIGENGIVALLKKQGLIVKKL